MSSFYGGRPGASFIITTTFSSVNEMIENFKLGPNYNTVYYDEYVLINTQNKTDPTNGNVYRRGYDYTNSLGGAEYIGNLLGAVSSDNAALQEIYDLRNAYDGRTFSFAGEAVRAQFINLNNRVSRLEATLGITEPIQ